MTIISLFLGIISLCMSVMNFVVLDDNHSDFFPLLISTLVFSAVCFLNVAITRIFKNTLTPSYILFNTAVMALLTTYLIFGFANGFSPLWIIMIPLAIFIFMGIKRGIWIAVTQFAIVVILLDTQVYDKVIQFNYSKEFRMRFPMLYICCFAIGLFFELLRSETRRELIKTQHEKELLMTTDVLTRLPNRLCYNKIINDGTSVCNGENACIFILDVDNFKKYNDEHGHLRGDEILHLLGDSLLSQIDDRIYIFRWGGEEFVGIISGKTRVQSAAIVEAVKASVRKKFIEENENITVSIGSAFCECFRQEDVMHMFSVADKALYEAKNTGKDKIVFDEYKADNE